MGKSISLLDPETSVDNADSFVFADVSAGRDKRITAEDLRADVDVAKVNNVDALFEGKRDLQAVNLLGYYTQGDGGGGLLYWDASSTETANGGTIFQVDGVATGRWVRCQRHRASLEWFGVNGEDATDALEYCLNNFLSVEIPVGTFYVNRELVVPSGVEIIGQGKKSIIKPSTGFTGSFSDYLFKMNNGTESVVFSDFSIIQDDIDIDFGALIQGEGCSDILIKDMFFESVFHPTNVWIEEGQEKPQYQTNHAIELRGSTNCKISQNNTVNGFRVAYRLQDYSYRNIVSKSSATNVHRGAMINTIYSDYDPAFEDYKSGLKSESELRDSGGSHFNNISECKFDKCLTFGIKVERGSWNNIISDNTLERCGEFLNNNGGCIVVGGWYNQVKGNQLHNPTSRSDVSNAGEITILGDYAINCTVSENTITNSPIWALYIGNSPHGSDYRVKNIKVTKNDFSDTDGIEVNSIEDSLIEGNTINRAVGVGIFCGSSTFRLSIKNNNINHPGDDGIRCQHPSNSVLTIEGNTIFKSGRNGIRSQGDSDFSIKHNKIIDPNENDDDNIRGIFHTDANNITITENTIYVIDNSISQSMRIQNADNIIIKNNTLSGNPSVLSDPQNLIVSDNQIRI